MASARSRRWKQWNAATPSSSSGSRVLAREWKRQRSVDRVASGFSRQGSVRLQPDVQDVQRPGGIWIGATVGDGPCVGGWAGGGVGGCAGGWLLSRGGGGGNRRFGRSTAGALVSLVTLNGRRSASVKSSTRMMCGVSVRTMSV